MRRSELPSATNKDPCFLPFGFHFSRSSCVPRLIKSPYPRGGNAVPNLSLTSLLPPSLFTKLLSSFRSLSMKLALKFISTVLLGLLFVSLFAHAAANPDVLASARETWMVALKAGDAAKTSSVFTADAISMPQNFPANVGRKSIQDFYIDGFATLVLQSIELHPVDRKINGPNTSANTAPTKPPGLPRMAPRPTPSRAATCSSANASRTAPGKSPGKSTP